MSISTLPAVSGGSTDEGGTLVASAVVVESGSKIPVALTAGTYSIAFYGAGTLNSYSYLAAGTGKFLGSIQGSADGSAAYSVTLADPVDGLAFSNASGTVVVRKFVAAASAVITDNSFRPSMSGLPSNSVFGMNRVAYSGSRWVVIPQGNPSSYSAYSDDGIFWTYSQNLPNLAWSDITYGNGMFVAIAGYSWWGGTTGSVVATSTDGITWTQRSIYTNYWSGITFGDGRFVAVAGLVTQSGTAAYSTDGITWTQSTMPSSSTWVDVEYGDGKFVAISNSTSFASSTDGITWTARTAAQSSGWKRIVWAGTRFVVIGSYSSNTQISNDGITWANGASPPNNASFEHTTLDYVNGVLFSSNHSQTAISYSTNNGTSWAQVSTPSGTANATAFIWTGSFYMLIASNGASSATSTNLSTWTLIGTGLNTHGGMFYVNGTYVALNPGNSLISVSTNGVSWTTRNTGYSHQNYSIMYGNGLYVLTQGGVGQGSYSPYLTSPDLITWTYRTMPVSQDWKRGIFANGRFILGAGYSGAPQTIYTSSNGINWIPSSGSPVYAWHFAYGNGRVVALPAQDGSVGATSVDGGLTWTQFKFMNNGSSGFSGVAYGNGIFVAISHTWTDSSPVFGGPIWTSVDGVTWERQSGFTMTPGSSGQIAFANGYFVYGIGGTVFASTNGKVWNRTSTGSSGFIFSAGGAQGVVMGDNQSANFAIVRPSVRIS